MASDDCLTSQRRLVQCGVVTVKDEKKIPCRPLGAHRSAYRFDEKWCTKSHKT